MPVIKCSKGKYKFGQSGKCIYTSKKQADKAARAIYASGYGKKPKIKKKWQIIAY